MIEKVQLTPKGKSEKEIYYLDKQAISAIVPLDDCTGIFLNNGTFYVSESPQNVWKEIDGLERVYRKIDQLRERE